MEFYWGYADYEMGMKLVEEMYRYIAQEVYGRTIFSARGHTFDLADEWRRVDYVSAVGEKTGIDILSATDAEMKAKLNELGVKYDGTNRERLTDTLWKYTRKQISGPAFLVNHPALISPLAKANARDPGTVERFQVILGGSEIGNGYSELNDPLDQRARFEKQREMLASGDDEAMMPDWDFVEMLEHGMPPTCGFGFGERLFAFLEDKPIREVQYFPFMKPVYVVEEKVVLNS
jgi:lysyl-tRNA synthetase, class II